MKKILFIVSVLCFLSDCYPQNVDLLGEWKSTDYLDNESNIIFFEDKFLALTINGEFIDGRNYIIQGGPNDGKKGEIKYEVNFDTDPIQIDVIALKDNEELGRLLGILKIISNDEMIMNLNFEGKRETDFTESNKYNSVTLIRIK